jgi:hypothetical protein
VCVAAVVLWYPPASLLSALCACIHLQHRKRGRWCEHTHTRSPPQHTRPVSQPRSPHSLRPCRLLSCRIVSRRTVSCAGGGGASTAAGARAAAGCGAGPGCDGPGGAREGGGRAACSHGPRARGAAKDRGRRARTAGGCRTGSVPHCCCSCDDCVWDCNCDRAAIAVVLL